MNTDTINPTGIDNLDREQIGDTEEFVRYGPHRQAEPDPEAERARQSDRIERRLRERARARRRLRIRASVGGAAVALIAAGAVAVLAGHVSTESSATQNTAAVQAPTSSGSSAGTLISYQRGAWVATLQRELAQLGYYHGSIVAIYGPDTTAAVEAFQSAHGLTVDGIAGPQTMAAIQQALAAGGTSSNGGTSSAGGTSSTPSASGARG